MATYQFNNCGMVANATCDKCDVPLLNGILSLDDGAEVQVYKCSQICMRTDQYESFWR